MADESKYNSLNTDFDLGNKLKYSGYEEKKFKKKKIDPMANEMFNPQTGEVMRKRDMLFSKAINRKSRPSNLKRSRNTKVDISGNFWIIVAIFIFIFFRPFLNAMNSLGTQFFQLLGAKDKGEQAKDEKGFQDQDLIIEYQKELEKKHGVEASAKVLQVRDSIIGNLNAYPFFDYDAFFKNLLILKTVAERNLLFVEFGTRPIDNKYFGWGTTEPLNLHAAYSYKVGDDKNSPYLFNGVNVTPDALFRGYWKDTTYKWL